MFLDMNCFLIIDCVIDGSNNLLFIFWVLCFL